MPWVVKECGWRGATGAGRAGLLVVRLGQAILVQFQSRSALRHLYRVESANCQKGYQWPRRVVGGYVVWLGFSACVRQGLMLFNSWLFIVLFLPVVLIGYFCAWPPQQSGAGGVAGAGVIGLLFLQQLAVRAAAAGLDRVQLRHRLSPDRAEVAPALCALPCLRPASPAICWCSASSNMPASLPPISMRCPGDPLRRQHRAAGRHLLLHFHADRVPGRCLSGAMSRATRCRITRCS